MGMLCQMEREAQWHCYGHTQCSRATHRRCSQTERRAAEPMANTIMTIDVSTLRPMAMEYLRDGEGGKCVSSSEMLKGK